MLGSFLTSDHDALVPVHVSLGLAMVALVVARIGWGLVGPGPARFEVEVPLPGPAVAAAAPRG